MALPGALDFKPAWKVDPEVGPRTRGSAMFKVGCVSVGPQQGDKENRHPSTHCLDLPVTRRKIDDAPKNRRQNQMTSNQENKQDERRRTSTSKRCVGGEWQSVPFLPFLFRGRGDDGWRVNGSGWFWGTEDQEQEIQSNQDSSRGPT